MSIQQLVEINLQLFGDGVATSFTYSFSKLYETINDDGGQITNPSTLPSAVSIDHVAGPIPAGGTASLDGFGNLVLNFPSAWAGEGVVAINLLFNSGTLSGTTAAWTSATALNTTWTLPLAGSNSCVIGFIVTGSVTGGTIVFEVSQDGANWVPVQGSIVDGYTALTGWTNGVGSRFVQFDTTGFAYIRNRLSVVLTGAGTVTFILQGSIALAEPVPTVGQANGTNLHMTLDDAAGGNAVNTSVKGTQAARALGVQELKDSGRNPITLSIQGGAGVIAEAMLSMGLNKGGVVTAAQTSYTITNGKTFRVQNIAYSVRAGAAAVPFSRVTLRSNTAGATIATSAILVQLPEVTGPAATTGVGGAESVDFPDGLEIVGNGTISIGLSHVDQATTNVINVTLTGYEY